MANGAPVHLNMKLTRAKLESLAEGLIDQTIEPMPYCLERCGSLPFPIYDDVILVGGMTRMPASSGQGQGVFR